MKIGTGRYTRKRHHEEEKDEGEEEVVVEEERKVQRVLRIYWEASWVQGKAFREIRLRPLRRR